MLLWLALFWITGALSSRVMAEVSDLRPGVGEAELLMIGLRDARSVRSSALGNLFIVESGRHRILKADQNGVRLDSLGRLGNGDYQFDTPVAIDPTNELKIYVADRNNRRIQVFDRRLQYLSTIRMPRRHGFPSHYRPTILAVDPSGRIYFFDEDRQQMYRFDSNGQYELDFELFSEEERIIPVSMAIWNDELWVADRRGELLHRFSSRGSYIGFIYAPEPVRALRTGAGSLWALGTGQVMRISSDGEIRQFLLLPGGMLQQPRNGDSGSQIGAKWHSFDVRNEYIYLLNAGTLVRLRIRN
ncbi:MAG: hypothetical protein R6U28_06230 [Cyclonatronaceae bacterium]